MLRTGWTYRQLLDTPARVLDALIDAIVEERKARMETQGGEPVIELGGPSGAQGN